jgi:hypothetical protein
VYVVGLGVGLLAFTAALGWLVAGVISLLVQWPSATVPGCPDGTSLYTRTEVRGAVAIPLQHCFADGDARDLRAQP